MEKTDFKRPAEFEIDRASSPTSSDDKTTITAATSGLTWDEAEERRIRRKLDWHIVPLVTLLYLLCFLDRANVGNARIQGMAKELDLGGYRFNWALTIFYFTYIA